MGVNYHSLADFRTAHETWLDAQLTRSITSLLDRRESMRSCGVATCSRLKTKAAECVA